MPAKGDRKVHGPDTLDRWGGETAEQHRALLLLAMQDPQSNPRANGVADGRNVTAVQRAIGRTRATLQAWQERRRWVDRIYGHGPDAQRYAIELYRHHYMVKHGEADLGEIGALVSLPMTSVRPTEVQERAAQAVRHLLPEPPPADVEERVQAAVDQRREDAAKMNRNLTGLGVLALKALKASLQAATDPKFRKENPHVEPVRLSVVDLPRVARMLRELEEERQRLENPELAEVGAGQVVDSVRVRIAKETGGSILQAIRADALEVVALVDAMSQPETTIADLEDARQDPPGELRQA